MKLLDLLDDAGHPYADVDTCSLTRSWKLSSYVADAVDVTFNFDAIPFGIGGVLIYLGRIVSWFTDAVAYHDINYLKIDRGKASAQQACEALAALEGMRIWKPWWNERLCTMALKGGRYCTHYGVDAAGAERSSKEDRKEIRIRLRGRRLRT